MRVRRERERLYGDRRTGGLVEQNMHGTVSQCISAHGEGCPIGYTIMHYGVIYGTALWGTSGGPFTAS